MRKLGLVLSLLAVCADDTPGNAAACIGDCPCGPAAPDWTATLPWLPVSNASWCPLGCATASGEPDTSGEYVVDVTGSVCDAFASWKGAAQRFLEPYGCPLTAYWRLSLHWFSPCFNSTSLALSGNQYPMCTTCSMPPVPSPPPPGAPAPIAPPQQTARLVNATLCLDAGDAANVTAVAAMLSAVLGANVSGISQADPTVCANQTPPPPAAPVPPASGPLASEVPPVQPPNGSADANSTAAVSITVAAPDDATARIISAALARLATPAGRDELASALHPGSAQRSGGISPVAAPPAWSPPPRAPALATRAKGDVGRRLLPVRILIAVLVSVPICCCLPLYLLGIAAWRAAQHSTCVVGIRGRMCDGASQGDREQLARCLHALVNAWAHTQLTTPHIKALTLRMQTVQEADRHVPWLWPAALTAPSFTAHQRTFLDRHGSLSTVDEDVEKVGGGSLVPELMDFQAVWELESVFRWPRTASLWRSAVQGGSITQDLDTHAQEVIDAALLAQLDCGSDDDEESDKGAQSVATILHQPWSPQLPSLLAMPPQLDVSVVLLSHRSPPAAPGENEVLLGQPLRRLSRRRTLYVAPHDGQLDSFPLATS
jgi:hypothetical protein